jgi:NADPH:quinone reductase-like Zn-dependent oxidoreductase
VVEAVGSEAKRFKVGDEVMFSGSHTRNGTNSEVTAVDERIVGKKPKSLSHTQTAAIPLVALTAWEGKGGLSQVWKKIQNLIGFLQL